MTYVSFVSNAIVLNWWIIQLYSNGIFFLIKIIIHSEYLKYQISISFLCITTSNFDGKNHYMNYECNRNTIGTKIIAWLYMNLVESKILHTNLIFRKRWLRIQPKVSRICSSVRINWIIYTLIYVYIILIILLKFCLTYTYSSDNIT